MCPTICQFALSCARKTSSPILGFHGFLDLKQKLVDVYYINKTALNQMCGLVYFFPCSFSPSQGRRNRGRGQGGRTTPTLALKAEGWVGTDYACHITTCPLEFHTFLMPCGIILFCDVNMQRSSELYQFFTESENGF